MDAVKTTQTALLTEVQEQSAKFGDDVKYLAEFTAGMKKFEPWIQKADAKRAVGMLKPKNLQEALDQLEGANVSSSIQLVTIDQSIASTKTKYIKLNTKTLFLISFDFCIHFKRENFFFLLFSCRPCQSV